MYLGPTQLPPLFAEFSGPRIHGPDFFSAQNSLIATSINQQCILVDLAPKDLQNAEPRDRYLFAGVEGINGPFYRFASGYTSPFAGIRHQISRPELIHPAVFFKIQSLMPGNTINKPDYLLGFIPNPKNPGLLTEASMTNSMDMPFIHESTIAEWHENPEVAAINKKRVPRSPVLIHQETLSVDGPHLVTEPDEFTLTPKLAHLLGYLFVTLKNKSRDEAQIALESIIQGGRLFLTPPKARTYACALSSKNTVIFEITGGETALLKTPDIQIAMAPTESPQTRHPVEAQNVTVHDRDDYLEYIIETKMGEFRLVISHDLDNLDVLYEWNGNFLKSSPMD